MKNQHEQILSPEAPCKDLHTFFFFFNVKSTSILLYKKTSLCRQSQNKDVIIWTQ